MFKRTIGSFFSPFLLLLCLNTPSHSQSSEFGNWMSYAMIGKFNPHWAIVGDYQWRNYNAFTDLQQLLLRTFAQYSVNERFSLGLGYAYVENGQYEGAEKSYLSEHRPSQQAILRWKTERTVFSLRFRTEQRFIESDPLKWRLRLFGSALWQLSKDSPWAVSATQEVFWYTEGSAFDQDRIFLGLSYRFNEHLRLESGGLLLIRKTSERGQLFTQLVHTFDW